MSINLLNTPHVFLLQLSKELLPRAVGYPWSLVYSSDKHGFSLKTMYRNMRTTDSPVMLAIKDTDGQVKTRQFESKRVYLYA